MQFDPEQIYAIIQTVIKWIQECKEAKATDETVEAEFKNPRLRTQLKLEREAKRVSGLRGAAWRKNKGHLMAQVHDERRSMEKPEIAYLIAEATDEDE
jgi:hypothetical protein